MYTGIKKLASLIKIVAKDIAKESNWEEWSNIGIILGIYETRDFFGEISVKNDTGYRAIVIGDTRGNISQVDGRKIPEKEHMSYMLLYSENCNYEGSKRIWKYRCFPSQKEIVNRLQKVVDKIPLIPMDKYNCDSNEFWYEKRDEKALTYLSNVVKRYADVITNDIRTPEEIFAACR